MNYYVSIIVILSLITEISKASLMIPSYSANPLDYSAYINTSKELKTFSTHYLETHPLQSNIDLLIEYFEKAQLNYFSNSMGPAADYYKKVISLSESDDWDNIHRKIIVLSFVRLAEVLNEPDFLRLAYQYAPEIDFRSLEIKESSKKQISKLLKESKIIDWKIQNLKNDFSFVILNGHSIDISKNETIKMRDGRYRATLISDKFKPQTFFLSAQQIPFIEPAKTPFFEGSCKNPIPQSADQDFKDIKVFYANDCILNVTDGNFVESKKTLSPEYNIQPVTQSFSYSEEKPFYKKTWFVTIVGAAVLGGIIYAVNKNKKNEDPQKESSREILP